MATVTLGTAGLAVLVMDTPITGRGGMLTNHHAMPHLWQLESVSLAAASAYRRFRDTIGTRERERAAALRGTTATTATRRWPA